MFPVKASVYKGIRRRPKIVEGGRRGLARGGGRGAARPVVFFQGAEPPLLSSHITSDLDKIADNITFIHHGRVLLSEGRDELIDRHGVLRCTEEQLNALDPDAVRAVRKGAFGCEALVKRDGIPENWPVEPVSVEQIMMFLTKRGGSTMKAMLLRTG